MDSESQDGYNTTQPTLLRHVGLYVLNGENFKSIKRKDVHNIIRLQKQNSKETLADYTNDYSTNATEQAALTDDKGVVDVLMVSANSKFQNNVVRHFCFLPQAASINNSV